MTGGYSLSLSLAPGSGLVGRRADTVLFIPEPDDRAKLLVDAFSHGSPDDIWYRLADTLIDHEFDICAFACLTAGERIEIRVFGSLELSTDLKSVPMLSGATSATWVEHRVHGHPATATVTTGTTSTGSNVDERTSLSDGIVPAGGFTAALIESSRRPVEFIDTVAPAPVADDPPSDEDSNEDATAHGTDSDLVDYVMSMVDEETTIDPPPVPEGTPLVASRTCKNGHPNPPSRAVCQICEVFLPAGADAVEHVPQPSLGTLVFSNGLTVELNGDIMVGRNPSRRGDHWIPVVLEGERLSRTHLTVRCRDWNAMVEDCGSHNGTVVVPAEGAQPTALVSGTPLIIEPGATAYFDAFSFVFHERTA